MPSTSAYPVVPTTVADRLSELETRFAASGAALALVVHMPALDEIDEAYGPAAADRASNALLQTVRKALGSTVSETDFVAIERAAGYDVLILVFRPRHEAAFYRESAAQLVPRLAAELEKQSGKIAYPYRAANTRASVGLAVALHNPGQRTDRQIISAFSEACADAALESRLRTRAIQRAFLNLVFEEQVHSVFQPVILLNDLSVLGYEALVRGPRQSEWQSPDTLFHLAEDSGLLYELDCLCRRAALRDSKGLLRGRKLFLNCLPSAIHDPGFSEEGLRHTLETCGLTPGDLVFEISEKESIRDFARFREIRERYRTLGIQVALDDTGAGYSGLEAVMKLSPDYIKIDVSLVRSVDVDFGRRVLLASMHALAETIGATLIAEGIETPGELATLREIGIPCGQGYLLGRPGPLR